MSIGKRERSTIAAIATPKGSGGIGIVRISGPRALDIAGAIFSAAGNRGVRKADLYGSHKPVFESHRVYYGHIVDPNTELVLDDVLLTVMKSPRSYTREDVVEISAHGGRVVLQSILELITQNGARLAEPGEFTRRAFLNGRIDLTQAEAVIDLINARSRSARQIAVNQIAGNLRQEIETARAGLLEILTYIEAGIDFPGNVEDDVDYRLLKPELLDQIVSALEKLTQNYHDAHVLRDGVRALIVGRPNVGKSSLLNRLVKRDRAIVTDIPGTTRDFIEESFHIDGTAVNVIDSAGFQDTDDPIESIGIQKTRELINGADVILFVVDATVSVCGHEHIILALVKEKKLIIVQNKCDLVEGGNPEPLPDEWDKFLHKEVSAKTGQNIDALKTMIQTACIPPVDAYIEDEIVPNLRQVHLLDTVIQNARQAALSLDQGLPPELIAIDLQGALRALNECLGLSVKEDILEEIFSRFCIGK